METQSFCAILKVHDELFRRLYHYQFMLATCSCPFQGRSSDPREDISIKVPVVPARVTMSLVSGTSDSGYSFVWKGANRKILCFIMFISCFISSYIIGSYHIFQDSYSTNASVILRHVEGDLGSLQGRGSTKRPFMTFGWYLDDILIKFCLAGYLDNFRYI